MRLPHYGDAAAAVADAPASPALPEPPAFLTSSRRFPDAPARAADVCAAVVLAAAAATESPAAVREASALLNFRCFAAAADAAAAVLAVGRRRAG